MAKLTLEAKTNSFIVNGLEFQKGSLRVNHSTDGISINGSYAKFSDVLIDGEVPGSFEDLKTWVSEKLFRSGGGDGSGSQSGVENVTGNLVSGTAKNPVVSLTGTPSDIVTFDIDGNPDVKPIGIRQLTDIGSFPPFANGVFTATGMNPATKTGLLSFVEFSTDTPKAGTFPSYNTGGRLPVGNATQPADAINLGQINGLLSPINQSIANKADLINNRVPESQLPSYIDNVQEYANLAALPSTGLDNVIYVTTDDNKAFRWGGTEYTQIASGVTIGETSATAYRGDRGKIAFDHASVQGNPHGLTKSDIGLSNVNDVSAAQLRDRSTHKGTQGLSTITDLVTIINAINSANDAQTTAISDLQSGKQDKIVAGTGSGTNFKTINGVSPLGSGNIVTDSNTAISTSTANNVKTTEYSNRFEYTCLIPFTASVPSGIGRYSTQTTNRILPSGITINNCDEHYISVRNSERAMTVAVWDSASRAICLGFGNTWQESVTATGSVFVKLVKYK